MPDSPLNGQASRLWLCCACLTCVTAQYADFGQKWNITRGDLIVAIPTDAMHLPLAQASRLWRGGIRTLIASNERASDAQRDEGASFNEIWTIWPDNPPWRSRLAGDTRAAIVPFLAHEHFGETYKWLLYGDDDTVWFVDGVLDLLSNLDPNTPYFITDALWYNTRGHSNHHGSKEAPRCLPCNFPDHQMNASNAPFRAPKGCPCTPQLLCEADERGIFTSTCQVSPGITYSMHGGAGAILSVGLLQIISLDFMESCISSLHSMGTGGDGFISICLWQAGYAFTDPGPSFFQPDLKMFDPGTEDRLPIMLRLSWALDYDQCDSHCQHMLDHMLTMHVRSRRFKSMEDTVLFVKAVTALYDLYSESKSQQKLQAASVAAISS